MDYHDTDFDHQFRRVMNITVTITNENLVLGLVGAYCLILLVKFIFSSLTKAAKKSKQIRRVMIIDTQTNKPYIVRYEIHKGKLSMVETPIRYKPVRYFLSSIRPLDHITIPVDKQWLTQGIWYQCEYGCDGGCKCRYALGITATAA